MKYLVLLLTCMSLVADDAKPIVIGEEILLPSKIMGEDRRVLVYLPEDYHGSDTKYPV